MKMGWNGSFNEMKIQICLTMKNPNDKNYCIVIDAGNIKEQREKNKIIEIIILIIIFYVLKYWTCVWKLTPIL